MHNWDLSLMVVNGQPKQIAEYILAGGAAKGARGGIVRLADLV